MVFPCFRAGEGNERPAEPLPVPAQPKNTWKWLGLKGGRGIIFNLRACLGREMEKCSPPNTRGIRNLGK